MSIYVVNENNPDALSAVKKITEAKDGDVVFLRQSEFEAFLDVNYVKILTTEAKDGRVRKTRRSGKEPAAEG